MNDCSSLLEKVNAGDERAFASLLSLNYSELRRMAAGLMRSRGGNHTLQPTALVNEAYLRLAQSNIHWDSRAHFFGTAAHAMRQILAGEARRRAALKRGCGAIRVTFSELGFPTGEPQLDVLALDEAIDALRDIDERFTQIIELRYFGGFTNEEIAQIADCSPATVKRDWTYARAWLYERMSA